MAAESIAPKHMPRSPPSPAPEYRVCRTHAQVPSLVLEGLPQRFCQQVTGALLVVTGSVEATAQPGRQRMCQDDGCPAAVLALP